MTAKETNSPVNSADYLPFWLEEKRQIAVANNNPLAVECVDNLINEQLGVAK